MGLSSGAYTNLTANRFDGPNGYEPQRENNGLLYITIPPEWGPLTTPMNAAAQLDSVLRFAIMGFDIPQENSQIIPVRYLNETRKYAGIPQFSDITLNIVDYMDLDTIGTLTAWRRRVYNPRNGKIGWKRSYSASGFIEQFGPNGQQVRTHYLVGVWPQQFQPGRINQGQDNASMCNLTLAIDKVLYAESEVNATDFTTANSVNWEDFTGNSGPSGSP